MNECDVSVIGSGVFGCWIAMLLRRRGLSVRLYSDQELAPHSASFTDTRIFRFNYFEKLHLTAAAHSAFTLWQELLRQRSPPPIHQSGVLWLFNKGNSAKHIVRSISSCSDAQLMERKTWLTHFPLIRFGDVTHAYLETNSGYFDVRSSMDTLTKSLQASGVEIIEKGRILVNGPNKSGRLVACDADGHPLKSQWFVFACGAWLRAMFPNVLSDNLRITRQEEYVFPYESSNLGQLPVILDYTSARHFAVPSLPSGGIKAGSDEDGPVYDPNHGDRRPSETMEADVYKWLQRRLMISPDRRSKASRVCQYEITKNREPFAIFHPKDPSVMLVGGGSGHSFKLAPYIAQIAVDRLLDECSTNDFLLSA